MKLKKYLPQFYLNSKQVIDILEVLDTKNEEIKIDINDLQKQLFVDTATWGIDIWERYLGILTNNDYDIDYRRSRIKSRLIGQGTITKKKLKNIIESFEHGQVDIIENTAEYEFIIRFLTRKGVPDNVNDIKNEVERLKPAHLKVIYEFLYNTWNEVNIYTWGETNRFTWDGLAQYEILYGLTHDQLRKMKEKELKAYKNNEMIKSKEV